MWQILEFALYSKYFWITALISGIYVYLKFFLYAYLKNQGIPHETPIVPFGNVLPVVMGKISLGNFIKESYEKFRNHSFYGIYIFNEVAIVFNDWNLIHQVLIKEFDKFHSRGLYNNEKIDPLMANIFCASGEKWKKLRGSLTTTFTPIRLKEIFPLIKNISDELIKICNQTVVDNDVIDIKDLMGRYTIDTIASVAFGYNCQSLSDPENEFKRYGEMAFDVSPLKTVIAVHAPIILYILRISYWSKDMTDFFSKIFQNTVEHRKQNKIVRKDFVNSLIELMGKGLLNGEKTNDEDKLTMLDAQAQAFIFFSAGYETSSSTMTYLLYELALNIEIQEKVHEEIRNFLTIGDINYNRIKDELPYLDMVLSETMRKHPTFSILNRRCNEDWQIPGSDFTIKKGTPVIVPVIGLHYNPEIYPDPEIFDPERFSKDNDSTLSSYVYLPFGVGPRYCLGAAFAKFQMKLGLVALLGNFKFLTCDKTVIPMQYSKRSYTQSPKGCVYLRMEKRMRDN